MSQPELPSPHRDELNYRPFTPQEAAFRNKLHSIGSFRFANRLTNQLIAEDYGSETILATTNSNLPVVEALAQKTQDTYSTLYSFFRDPTAADALRNISIFQENHPNQSYTHGLPPILKFGRPAAWIATCFGLANDPHTTRLVYGEEAPQIENPLINANRVISHLGLDDQKIYQLYKNRVLQVLESPAEVETLKAILAQPHIPFDYWMQNRESLITALDTHDEGGWFRDLVYATALLDANGRLRVPQETLTQAFWDRYKALHLSAYPTPRATIWDNIHHDPMQVFHSPNVQNYLKKLSQSSAAELTDYEKMWIAIWEKGFGELRRMQVGARISESPEVHHQVRTLLLTHIPELSLKQPVVEIVDRMEERHIDWKEDPRHPLAHLFPTIGIEWEHQPIDQPTSKIRDKMVAYGYLKDQQHHASQEEHAPRYSHHVDTLQMIYHLLHDSQMINTYQTVGGSIHLNIGFPHGNIQIDDDIFLYTRLLQGTTWAYYPFRRGNTGDSDFTYRIFQKPDSKPNHIEFKEFAFLGMDNLDTFTTHAFYIGSTLGAYRVVRTPQRGTVDQLRLARVYQDASNRTFSVYKQLEWGKLLEKQAPRAVSRQFANHIHAAFGNVSNQQVYWRMLDEIGDPTKSVELTPVTPVVVDSNIFPNVIAASRFIARTAQRHAAHILRDSEADAVRQLQRIHNTPYPSERSRLQLEYFSRFPSGVKTGLKEDAQLQAQDTRLEELFDHYDIA